MPNVIDMNIGKWIVASFVLFIGFIATLVTICMKQDVNLVSKDYYKEELAYQAQIERLTNAASLANKPEINIANRTLEISFSSLNEIQNGELKLFCPSNPKMDRNFVVQASGAPQRYNISDVTAGMYRARFMWTMNGKEFYFEKVVYI